MSCYSISVCVPGPPRVSNKVIHRQTARLGSAIKFPCPVEGDPPPLIMWTKDGRNIHSGWTRFRILRMGLKIKEVEADDTGTYICKATNGFGSVNINYTLIVIGECRPCRTSRFPRNYCRKKCSIVTCVKTAVVTQATFEGSHHSFYTKSVIVSCSHKPNNGSNVKRQGITLRGRAVDFWRFSA